MEPIRPQTLMSRLKQATQDAHVRLERFPFFSALSNGTLPLISYVNQLRTFATVFGALEHEASGHSESSIRTLSGLGESRFTQLLRDLSCFADQKIPEMIKARRHADEMAARIRILKVEDPSALIGYLYALQGTILGNRVHLPDVQGTFSLDQNSGAAFYAGYGDQTDEIWAAFASLVNGLELENAAIERILDAALEAFNSLYALHEGLFPVPGEEGLMLTATSLNPEAGDHPVPADERETSAAILAGRLCREEFPYFDARYGARGRRFADSDTAWLATLVTLPPPLLIAQIAWLGSVLASRGMPRITLERQLYYLHRELIRAAPEKSPDFEQLKIAQSWLEKERWRHISPDAFGALCQRFIARTDRELGGKLKGTGTLIISAVCDESAGIAEAVSSLEPWLSDGERFSAQWIAAVRDTIVLARQMAV